jgi:putative nucleotidyltransferase with HDIG domain
MSKMAMLDNIVAHSIRVCQVATVLTDILNSNGSDLDPDLIRAAALLHDITKTRSLETAENHAATGALYLRELEYPEVSDIVGQHVNLAEFDAAGKPTAAEVVNYADKRVLHDKVVSLEERMAYIKKRYSCAAGELGNRLERMFREVGQIETKLFKSIPFAAMKLADHLDPDVFSAGLKSFREHISDHTKPPT